MKRNLINFMNRNNIHGECLFTFAGEVVRRLTEDQRIELFYKGVPEEVVGQPISGTDTSGHKCQQFCIYME